MNQDCYQIKIIDKDGTMDGLYTKLIPIDKIKSDMDTDFDHISRAFNGDRHYSLTIDKTTLNLFEIRGTSTSGTIMVHKGENISIPVQFHQSGKKNHIGYSMRALIHQEVNSVEKSRKYYIADSG